MILDFKYYDKYVAKHDDKTSITFEDIRNYVKIKYGINISKSSITEVKKKCKINNFDNLYQNVKIPCLKSEKEKLVLEAMKHFNIIV